MQKRKFDELISHFNRKVSDMSIDQKYKMELLGMISAIGLAHENELGTDCISRQAAIDALDVLCQEHRYKIPGKRETYSQYNEAWQDALDRAEGAIFNLPPAQPEQRTGEWEITDAYPHTVYCSECHKRFAQTHWAVWEDGSLPRNFCPNCGAKMTEGVAE